jgi:predicted porin
MKKSLIALAVLTVSGLSFAQSSVTVFGTFDPSITNQKTTYGNGAAVTQNLIRNNSQGTSQLSVKGVEDLGGGLKASFLLENDFDAGKDATANLGSLGGEQYAAIEGGFGKVALGAANTPSLFTQSSSQPFGTKIGGGFGAANTGRVRSNNSIVYSAPVMSGLTLMAAYATQTKLSTVADQGKVSTGANTDIGALYANGPLSAGVTAWSTAAAPGATGAPTKNTQTNAYVAYDFGVAKLGLGYFAEKQDVTGAGSTISSGKQNIGALDSVAYNFGATVPLSASLNLLASYTQKDDKTALNLDRKVAAIGLKYTLSARTSVYARYVDDKISNMAAGANQSSKQVTTMLAGVQHNF